MNGLLPEPWSSLEDEYASSHEASEAARPLWDALRACAEAGIRAELDPEQIGRLESDLFYFGERKAQAGRVQGMSYWAVDAEGREADPVLAARRLLDANAA